jgi:predicted enzyme related to lactoylglutathione lyase
VTLNARYVHTNLVTRDWRTLAEFYENVFGCTRLPPERDLAGEWLSAATGVPDAALRGVHLRLPSYGDQGPTLEVFLYQTLAARAEIAGRPMSGNATPSPPNPGRITAWASMSLWHLPPTTGHHRLLRRHGRRPAADLPARAGIPAAGGAGRGAVEQVRRWNLSFTAPAI